MKNCSRCFLSKEYCEFSKKTASKDGYKSHCKNCEKLDRMKNFQRDKELKQRWISLNKERDRSNKQKYNIANKEKIAIYLAAYRRNYEFNRLNNDIQHKLRNRLRSRLHSSFVKTGSTVGFLGCSLEDLKIHLESKFQLGMTWENWSRFGWHIDHIKPLSSFDLTNEDQLRIACHYTNLQPLWAKDNLKKSNKV